VAPGQHFLQLPSHHPATKKHRPSPLSSTMLAISSENYGNYCSKERLR